MSDSSPASQMPSIKTRLATRQRTKLASSPEEHYGGWSTEPKRAEEKDILSNMMLYLPDDPTLANNNTVLRFLLREWPKISQTIHTAATLDRLKSALLPMNIPYIQYQVSPSYWSMWKDYTPAGITRFHQQDLLGIHNDIDILLATNTSGGSTSEHSTWTIADTVDISCRETSAPSTHTGDSTPTGQTIPGAATNLQQVAGTPLMTSYPPAEIPPVIHNPYLKKIPPTPVQDTHDMPAGIAADQSPSSTRRQGPPPQQMHEAPRTSQASISAQHQLDDYLVQSITSIDKHCQHWLSTFTRREGDLQQQEQTIFILGHTTRQSAQ